MRQQTFSTLQDLGFGPLTLQFEDAGSGTERGWIDHSVQPHRLHIARPGRIVDLKDGTVGSIGLGVKSEGRPFVPKCNAMCLRLAPKIVQVTTPRLERLRLKSFIGKAFFTRPDAQLTNIRPAIDKDATGRDGELVQVIGAGQPFHSCHHPFFVTAMPYPATDVDVAWLQHAMVHSYKEITLAEGMHAVGLLSQLREEIGKYRIHTDRHGIEALEGFVRRHVALPLVSTLAVPERVFCGKSHRLDVAHSKSL